MDATATSPASYAAIPDAALDACEEKVLTMLELSAQIAEGLAGGLATPPEATDGAQGRAIGLMAILAHQPGQESHVAPPLTRATTPGNGLAPPVALLAAA